MLEKEQSRCLLDLAITYGEIIQTTLRDLSKKPPFAQSMCMPSLPRRLGKSYWGEMLAPWNSAPRTPKGIPQGGPISLLNPFSLPLSSRVWHPALKRFC